MWKFSIFFFHKLYFFSIFARSSDSEDSQSKGTKDDESNDVSTEDDTGAIDDDGDAVAYEYDDDGDEDLEEDEDEEDEEDDDDEDIDEEMKDFIVPDGEEIAEEDDYDPEEEDEDAVDDYDYVEDGDLLESESTTVKKQASKKGHSDGKYARYFRPPVPQSDDEEEDEEDKDDGRGVGGKKGKIYPFTRYGHNEIFLTICVSDG